jgi:hypothetical protein
MSSTEVRIGQGKELEQETRNVCVRSDLVAKGGYWEACA